MTTDLTRPDDVTIDRDRLVALGYLARYREPTRGHYELCLGQWFAWCAQRGIRPLTAKRPHIEIWARELEELRGNKLSTVAGKLTPVAGFYRFARIDGYIVDDPAEYLRKPSIPRVSTTTGLTRSEALRCLDLAEASGDLQDHALWCVLLLNGFRVGEALALDVEDLGRTGGYRTVKVAREKGNRSGEVPLAPRTSTAIDRHLGSRTSGPLFRKRPVGDRMDRKAANRIVKRIVKAAGIDKRISPHSLRHTHITMALNAGVSVRNIVNSLGYTDARQVSYYDRDKDSLQRNDTHWVAAYIES